MRLLVDFLCRFGWGMALALALTPSSLVPAGFFRVNLLVVLGLASVAACLARIEVPGPAWAVAAAASVVAWVGSVAWFGERTRMGQTCCSLVAILLATATVLVQVQAGVPPAGEALVAGLVVGLTVHAMLLGHWYLNAPGMSVAGPSLPGGCNSCSPWRRWRSIPGRCGRPTLRPRPCSPSAGWRA
jgi:hypothetical protein